MTGVVLGMVLLAGGIAAVVTAAARSRRRAGAPTLAALVADLGPEPIRPDGPGPGFGPGEAGALDPVPSLVERVMRPVARRATDIVRSLYPGRYLDRLHRRLLWAGLATSLRAEEVATLQVIAVGAVVTLGAGLLVAGGGSLELRLFIVATLVLSAVLGPPAWLARRVRERTQAIERELPDVLDLLTIAVEAGLGLEQAMEAACADFESPVSEELARCLQEMSLGLSRQEALANLEARTDSRDLTSFVLVLTQADALGMPIGRVLRTQADEMRGRRRDRARERAARLPVKILFPLIFFILPPLMIVVLGPAVSRIWRIFG